VKAGSMNCVTAIPSPIDTRNSPPCIIVVMHYARE
jgi:hypothetical protein